MLDQSINPDSLRFVIKDYERNFKFKNEFDHDDEQILINTIMDFFYDKNSNFRPFIIRTMKGKFVYQLNGFSEYFLAKRFTTTFRYINRIKQSNRNEIVDAIIALLDGTINFNIIRLDIKDFYESIDREGLLNSLELDDIYSPSTIEILKKIFQTFNAMNISGLPRGLSISAILSEYYLRPFDKKCKSLDGVYYYARFVDDIIIFTTKKTVNLNEIKGLLPNGLEFHLKGDKYQIINVVPLQNTSTLNSLKFSYLGYEFSYRATGNKNNYEWYIDISPKKISKIKTRIIEAFLDYNKTKDFRLFLDRIRFLTHNFYIKNQYRDTKIKTGIFYNYKKVDFTKIESSGMDLSLDKLDRFLRQMVFQSAFSTKKLGFKHSLTKSQSKAIAKMSFKKGFIDKKFHKFSTYRLIQIKRCWIY